MKRNLLFPLILSQSLVAQAWIYNKDLEKPIEQVNTQIAGYNEKLQGLCGDDKKINLEDAQAQSNKLWHEIVQQINNARIPYGIEKSIQLTDRTSIQIGKQSISETSVGGKYSGIDKWRFHLGATLLHSSVADLNLDGTREVTFIQQFPSRCKSLVRLAYDPITKIPLNSDRALNRLNPGEFVAFSSPLTLSLGKNLDRYLGAGEKYRSLGGGFVYATGEFNIHVYRMDKNYVRVRLFASKTKGAGINPGLKFYILGGAASIKIVEGELSQSLTNLFSADYVFNLNDPESRDLYDKAMGEKFELTKVAFEGTNPFAKDNTVQKRLFADLGAVEEASIADLNKDLNSRRIIRLSKGETETTANRFGIGFDLRVAKAKQSTTYSDSALSLFDVTNQNQKYTIKTITRQNEWDVFTLWGQEDTHNTALLVLTDDSFKPRYSTGLQTIRIKEDTTLTRDELRGLKAHLNRLPEQIVKILNIPDPDKLKGDISNARIEQSIFLDTQVLESQRSITKEAVKQELQSLVQKWGRLGSKPMSVNENAPVDSMDSRLKSWKDADIKAYYKQNATKEYMAAYSWELDYIPAYLGGLFGPESIEKKLAYYESLQQIPLFNEIGITLVLNLIGNSDRLEQSEAKMKDVVSYRLSITGRGIEAKVSEYPNDEQKSADGSAKSSENLRKSEIFRRILNDNSYLIDRSLNLRYYMNEKGDSLSLKEVVDRSK